MLEALNQYDTQLFYFINSHHCMIMDWVMWFVSSKWMWLLVIVFVYCFTVLKQERNLWWLVLLAIGACFLLADQGSVHLFKNTVCRPRPCRALPDVHLFHEKCGKAYGFVSSHAANAFALLTFFWMRYVKGERFVPLGSQACEAGRKVKGERLKAHSPLSFMAVWAVVMCYSRCYLGKHYPGDVLCGALFGILMGYLVHLIIKWLEKKLHKSETKS